MPEPEVVQISKEDWDKTQATITALQTTIETISKEWGVAKPYIDQSSKIISTIADTPELKESLKTALTPGEKKEEKPGEKKEEKPAVKTETTPKKDPTVVSLDNKQRQDIVAETERKFGYTNLKEEDRKTMRRAVEKHLNKYGRSIVDTPVDELPELLKDAYFMFGVNNVKTSEDSAQIIESFKSNESAAIPSISSSRNEKDSTELTSEDKEWAKKLEVPEDKVLANLKEFNETGKVTYKPPKEDGGKKETTPYPSATPQKVEPATP